MAWIGGLIGAGVSLLGDAMSSDKNGGAGSSSTSTEPWFPAMPWLLQNLVQGQNLQSEYTARPFSARQQAAYDNSYAMNDYIRGLVPGLLGQMEGQPVGFDKKNPNARPKAWDWSLLSDGMNQRPIASIVEPTPEAKKEEKKFAQQDMGYTAQQQALIDSGRSPWLMGHTEALPGAGGVGNGGYGAYRYGDKPVPGTQAYRDMTEFFLMGGNDPWGIAPAGLGIKRQGAPGGLLGNSGNSIGGSPSADGSGGGSPGVW